MGFLLTQSAVLLIAFLLGAAASPDRDRGHETLAAALGLAAGVALIALAARQRSTGEPEERIGSSRTEAFLARLGRLRPATAFSFGALLGVGGVKRLTITLLAGASIALRGSSRPRSWLWASAMWCWRAPSSRSRSSST